MAIAALRRIARKRAGFTHREEDPTGPPPETCDCPKCIAKDMLEQIYDITVHGPQEVDEEETWRR